MFRNGLLVLVAGLCAACMGLGAEVLRGDLNTETNLEFDIGATEATGALLAFDPTQHRMDIVISIEPLDQADDMNIVIVTDGGTRFQVLGSFAACTEEDGLRRCERQLPILPNEQVGSWRVEAVRGDSTISTSVQVAVNWISINS
ncbi:MAG TPA: hypothetical protein VJ938_02670 [Acidimicrobiia bacterium]|nr:hypothetical protein [Acidimicrobiia bacterium]